MPAFGCIGFGRLMIQLSRRRVGVVSLLGHRPSSIVGRRVGFDSGLRDFGKKCCLKKHGNHLVLTNRHTCKNRTTIICPNLIPGLRSYFLTDYQERHFFKSTRGYSDFFRSLHATTINQTSYFPIGLAMFVQQRSFFNLFCSSA